MIITCYSDLFKFFDNIISFNSDNSLFYFKDVTYKFKDIVKSYYRCDSIYPSSTTLESHSSLLASVSLGYTSLFKCPYKKLYRRYQLSFLKVFPVISTYICEPYSYFAYNLYPKDENVFISRDLFVNDVNLAGFYSNKFFIVHSYNEYNDNTPFITILSPSIMFTGDLFDFVDH